MSETKQIAGIETSAEPQDRRKTAALARLSDRSRGHTRVIAGFAAAREILRSGKVVQAGAGAAHVNRDEPEEISLFYQDGEAHRRRRAAISPYFTLKAIETRYQAIMERVADRMVAGLAAAGGGRLDRIAFRFAVAVAAEILGLDYHDLEGLTRRIEATISRGDGLRPIRETADEAVQAFYAQDVLPAIAARRRQRREDVISRLLDDGCSERFICTEMRGYAFAGMVTTREFIVMSAWYFLEQPELLARFRAADKAGQLAIASEILRLEPIVGYLKRVVVEDIDLPLCGHIPAGTAVAIDIRAANMDAHATGACPQRIDPNRGGAAASGGFLSFGDGPHRCPGAQLSVHEARIFLDRLVRLNGLRFLSPPDASWFKPISSYELSGAIIACDTAAAA